MLCVCVYMKPFDSRLQSDMPLSDLVFAYTQRVGVCVCVCVHVLVQWSRPTVWLLAETETDVHAAAAAAAAAAEGQGCSRLVPQQTQRR